MIISLLCLTTEKAHAAPFTNFQVTITQPDGTEVKLYAIGDEYYNWVQDAQGYTVLQDPDRLLCLCGFGQWGVGSYNPYCRQVDPASMGLHPYTSISPVQREQIREALLEQNEKAVGMIPNAHPAVR